MTTVLAFIVAIIVIVAIHEFGHYLAMRAFGIRVLAFSIGFGPRLLSWRDKHGTDFMIAAIPLGGYVKPLDRRESEVLPSQLDEEFSGKPAWQRVITYAAGPFANLVLAVLLMWLTMLGGETGRIPYLAQPEAGTAAARAGLHAGEEIIQLGDSRIQNWPQVVTALLDYAGDTGTVPLKVRDADGSVRSVDLPLANWASHQQMHPLDALGLMPRPFKARVGKVEPGSAAEHAGMQPGDLVLSVDGKPVKGWEDWVAVVRAHPEQAMVQQVQRGDTQISITLIPARVSLDGKEVGQAGVYPDPDIADVREIHYGPLSAFAVAVERVGGQIGTLVRSIGKLLTGQLSVKTLGGPLTIADAAGNTAAMGWVAFAGFLSFLSVSLGIINLLPVPMLDGGWIVFGVIEMIIGRSLPERFLMAAQSVGMAMVLCLMVVAIFNDLVRHFA